MYRIDFCKWAVFVCYSIRNEMCKREKQLNIDVRGRNVKKENCTGILDPWRHQIQR